MKITIMTVLVALTQFLQTRAFPALVSPTIDKSNQKSGNTEEAERTTLAPKRGLFSFPSTRRVMDQPHQVEVLEPGLVLIRGLVNDKGCQQLAQAARKMGSEGEDGFFTESGELNTGEAGRGRIYDAATRFPSFVTDQCQEAVATARSWDKSMPDMECTHCLLNMYTNADGLCWHRDIYENDGTSDHPIVNLCVGASCTFGYKHQDSDKEKLITLRNGDCLLFGGQCRLIKHAVLDVHLDECPKWMQDEPVRFSFSFRDSPEVLGREHEFKYFKVKEHLVGQDRFDSTLKAKDNCRNWKQMPSQASQRKICFSSTN